MNRQKYTLQQLGWSQFFSNQIDTDKIQSGLIPARIISSSRSLYKVLTDQGEFSAEMEGKYYYSIQKDELDIPAVGDWVLIKTSSDEFARIVQVLKSESALYRCSSGKSSRKQILASNLDYVFIVSGLDRDFNIRRLERYVTMAWESGAVPVILLNKSDLPSADELQEIQCQVESIAPFVAVHLISALNDTGITSLGEYLQSGKTVALIGSSGCGKSTLVNNLAGLDLQKINSVRSSDGRGRHTTVSRDLIILESGGIIIDNPGLREIQLYADENALDMTFADIEEFASECKFSDCTHQSEPGCKVQQALLDGDLVPARYASYVKLQKELAFLRDRVSGKKNAKLKEISKFQKKLKKYGKQPGQY